MTVLVLPLVCASIAGCGDGEQPLSCTGFAACGGTLVGTWQLQPECNPEVPPQVDSCGATVDFSGTRSDTTMSFGADGILSFVTSNQGNVDLTLPSACLAGPVATCEQAGAELAARLSAPGSKQSSMICRTEAGTCRCTVVLRADPLMEAGTYVVTGNSFTIGASGVAGAAQTFEYCATGRELRIFQPGQQGQPGTISVLKKQ